MKQDDLLKDYYVEYKGEYAKILGVTTTNHIILIETRDGERHLVKDENIDSIELTPDILEKFGFEIEYVPYNEAATRAILDLGDDMHYIELTEELGGWRYDNFIILNNVHNLQKLLSLYNTQYPNLKQEIKL